MAAHGVLLQILRRLEPWRQGAPIDDSLVWFTLHAVANAAIVAFAWRDTLHLLTHPLDAFGASEGRTQGIVMAIHLYHVLGFKLSRDDKVHHAVSVGVVGTMGYMFRLGKVQDAMNFFVCGLPGGIDYVLLAAVKAGLIPKITEKRINLWLQVAIRWPGMLLCINHAIVSKISHGDDVSLGWLPLLIMSSLHGWNGLYYAQRVCGTVRSPCPLAVSPARTHTR